MEVRNGEMCMSVCVYAVCPSECKRNKKQDENGKFRGRVMSVSEEVLRMKKNTIFLLGDINAKIESTEIGGVVGKFGVDDVNENGQYLVDILC